MAKIDFSISDASESLAHDFQEAADKIKNSIRTAPVNKPFMIRALYEALDDVESYQRFFMKEMIDNG